MSKQAYIRRYTLIIEKVSANRFPSLSNLRSFLFNNGFEISTRTLQRDIEQIRYEFGIEITYERERNGYFIDTENSINIEGFLRFLEIANTAELLMESLKDSKNTLSHISFEAQGDLKGIENLKPLLAAIMQHRKVTFVHENFTTGKTTTYTIKPYLLKEYQNRWYLVGIAGNTSGFMTYGIDRIHELKILDTHFKPNPGLNPTELFENTIGLTYSFHKVEEVELSFTPFQGKYVKALPLHKSQQVILDNDQELRIKLRIIPNFEFRQKIMMHGESLKVIKPDWLVGEIKRSLSATLKQYE